MDLKLTFEQEMLRDSVARLMQQDYNFLERANYARDPRGWSQAIWQQYADIGLLALPFEESDGGMGAGAVECMVVMQAMGRALTLEPYWSCIVLCGALWRHADATQRARWLPQLMSGQQIHAFAHTEPDVHHPLHLVSTQASRTSGGWRLHGRKTIVLNGDSADWLLVTARVHGQVHEADGLSLFAVSSGAPGLKIRGYHTMDGRRAADVDLSAVEVDDAMVLGEPGKAWDIMEPAFDRANAALCAEGLGLVESMFELTLDYVKTRQQFGSALGSFQVIQHELAQMHMDVEQVRSMALLAALSCELEDAQLRRQGVSSAKAFIAQAARKLGQSAIQLHGGIGMTEEYKVGHDFKRATTLNQLLGDVAYHKARVARAGGLFQA